MHSDLLLDDTHEHKAMSVSSFFSYISKFEIPKVINIMNDLDAV